MYTTGVTIEAALREVAHNEYVLPAIQREFVWRPVQICKLFDSLMQGYPFGAFLFWMVEPSNSHKFQFYGFVRDYHERDNPHCPKLPRIDGKKLTVVLDGQQRLTALNIGLHGSLAIKLPNKWRNNPHAFPRRRLYLDLLARPRDEEGNQYEFQFLEPEKVQEGEGSLWFPVGEIVRMQSGPAMLRWLANRNLTEEQTQTAFEALDTLHRVIRQNQSISYYEEKRQELGTVLNVFIRLNSGGTPLSYSDLLLSMATAQWQKLDAREEVHRLVDELNRVGREFSFSKDFVLKAGLMLADTSVGFNVENFTQENMLRFEQKWPDIRRALLLTVQLADSIGFSGQTLRADSALLPIAYYLHLRGAPDNYILSAQYQADRANIRSWLLRSLLKPSGIWGSGLDTFLTALRSTLLAHQGEQFPTAALQQTMAASGKSLHFEPEEIDDLADMEHGDRNLFMLMALLFDFVNLRNQFHIDHVFPAARFTRRRLLRANVPEDEIDQYRNAYNRLGNLQLLEGQFNNEKRAHLPADWLQMHLPTEQARQHYCQQHDLAAIPEGILDFPIFYEERRTRLRQRIEQMVNEA